MSDYVEQGQVKQVIVQIKDGSTWTAEIDLDGKVHLLKQLSDPQGNAPKPQEQAGEGNEEQQDQQQAQRQPAPQPTQQDKWGEESQEQGEAQQGSSVQDLLDKMLHRDQRTQQGGQGRANSHWSGRSLPKGYMGKLKDHAFRGRLSSIMRDNMFDRRVKGRTRGKLDMTKLFKVPTGSRNVFMQKQARKGKKYNVVFLVDQSSSMAGSQIELATESILFLGKQFDGLGIKFGVIGYHNSVFVHKEINDPLDYNLLHKRVNHADAGTSSDYDAMRRGYKMLSKEQGEKILIMLSDGGPGHSETEEWIGSDGENETPMPKLDDKVNWNERQHLHHLAKSQKDVHSIGIGIMQGGWQIPDHTVIHDINDLKKTMIAALRRHIKRG